MPAPTLAGADIETLSTDELEEGICGFAARLAAATCVFVLAVAEYDRRRAWETWECRSMAHWLSWKCAMGPVAAREHVRVGAALGELELIRERFSTGALSYSQVRAITRVATVDTQDDLVHLARAMTAAQLETVVRAYRRARPGINDPDRRAPVARRTLTCYTDDDGSLVGTFRLTPEDGAPLVKALSAATERRRSQDGEAVGDDGGDRTLDPAGAERADALVDLANAYLRQAEAGETDGDKGRSADAADRYVVNIIAERRVLEGTSGDHSEGVCQIEHGPGVSPGDRAPPGVRSTDDRDRRGPVRPCPRRWPPHQADQPCPSTGAGPPRWRLPVPRVHHPDHPGPSRGALDRRRADPAEQPHRAEFAAPSPPP